VLDPSINDPLRQHYGSGNTHSSPNSYTADNFYHHDDHLQSLGVGALSVASSVLNPHQSMPASTIQSALHNLNATNHHVPYNHININTSMASAQVPSMPVPSSSPQKNLCTGVDDNETNESKPLHALVSIASNDNDANNENLNNMNSNRSSHSNHSHSNSGNATTAPSNSEAILISANSTNASNFYLQPGSANHSGSYRQTLNPAIYNAYRLSSAQSANQTPQPLTNTSLTHRSNAKAPVVHVIQETIYHVPTLNSRLALRKQDRFDKTALYKTELCTNWMLTGSCTYGNKCHFAHGVEDLKPRMRVENYKTQPCCDPAREGCRRCMYGRRCNYCHPGEPIRRPHPTPYYDKDYYGALQRDFGQDNEFPFGIYV
jgi:hypothetical protein